VRHSKLQQFLFLWFFYMVRCNLMCWIRICILCLEKLIISYRKRVKISKTRDTKRPMVSEKPASFCFTRTLAKLRKICFLNFYDQLILKNAIARHSALLFMFKKWFLYQQLRTTSEQHLVPRKRHQVLLKYRWSVHFPLLDWPCPSDKS